MKKETITPYIKSLINLQKTPENIKFGLERIKTLLKALDNPQKNYQILHVAGTNGKGSTCTFLDSICRESGLRSGKFISPHLNSIRERIVINNKIINKYDFIYLEKKVSIAALTLIDKPSFFEHILAMALLGFKEAKIEIAILEVGVGGRLDATNIITPVVCGISQIDMDHVNILGNSIKKIAIEKAGIIKSRIPIITIQQHKNALNEIKKIAKEKNAPLTIIKNSKTVILNIKSGLEGSFQDNNLALAIEMLNSTKLAPKLLAIKKGAKNARWPGRYEVIKNNPKIIFDGAHNSGAIKTLINTLLKDSRFMNIPMFVVLGMTHSHNSLSFIKNWLNESKNIFPQKLFITQSKNLKSIKATKLAANFTLAGFNLEVILQSHKALNIAIKLAKKNNGYVLVTGSLYLVGELRSIFFKVPIDPILPNAKLS